MLSVKFAEAYVDLILQTRKYYADLRAVQASLARVPGTHTVTINVNRAAATSNINLFMQQLRSAQALTRFQLQVARPAGFGGFGRGGGGGAGGMGRGGLAGFLQGAGQGAGMPYTSSPYMAGGYLASKGAIEAVKTAVDLETEFATLRRITGLTADQMDRFKSTIMGMAGTRPGVSTQDLVEMAQIGGRMGVVDRAGMGGLAEFTGQLARVKLVVQDIDTETLANNIGRVLNVFDLGTNRVAGFGSALTAMDNISTASAKDLLDITQRLSGTAHAIGLTLPQVVAFSSVLKDVGLSNEIAGSSFSQIFRKMGSDSEKFADKIGVDAKAFADAYRKDPMQALGMVIAKFKELNDTIAGQEFLSGLGLKGVRVAGALQQLAVKFDEVNRRASIAAGETGGTGALQGAEAIMGGTTGTAFQRTKNAFTDLADAAGGRLAPAGRAAANVLSDIASALASIVRGTTQASFAGVPGAAGAGPLAALPAAARGKLPLPENVNEAEMAVESAKAVAERAETEANAADARAKQFGFEARQAMAGAGGDPARFAAAMALFGGVEKAEKDAAAAAAEMAAAGDALRDAVRHVGELRAKFAEQEDTADERDRRRQAVRMFTQAPGRVADVMAAMGGLGQGVGVAGRKGLDLIDQMRKAPETPHFAAGLSGEDVGRRIQEDILGMTNRNAEETARNTRPVPGLLGEIKEILRAQANNVGAAVLGQ